MDIVDPATHPAFTLRPRPALLQQAQVPAQAQHLDKFYSQVLAVIQTPVASREKVDDAEA
jgi:hypothetical protein